MEDTYWDAEMMLNCYIYDYLLRRNLHVTAQTFVKEAKVPRGPVAIDDSSTGFLFEWWSIFSDVYFRRQSNYEVHQAMNKVLPFEPINQEMPSLPLYLPRQVEHVKIPNSPQMLTNPTSTNRGQEGFNSLSLPFNQMQQFPSFTQQQEQLLPHGLQASMVGNYAEPSTATCTDIHPPMLIPRGNVFSKINNQTGSQSVPKDQEMVLSTLEEEDQSRGQQSKKFTRKGKEPLYSTKDSSQPGDTVGPSNVASAILGGTPCPTSTSRIISECFGTTDKRMLDNSVKGGESFEISELMNEAMDADNGLAENNVESEPSPEADDD